MNHSRKNETMTLKGVIDPKGPLEPIDLDQPFSDRSIKKHYGLPITPILFNEMLDRFRRTMGDTDVFKDLWWVEFSKASIFRILAQEQCDYVRFYFAIPDAQENKASLMMQGIDSNRETIGRDMFEEVSKKMIEGQNQENEKAKAEAILKSLAKNFSPTEEKGNGGAGRKFTLEENVQSLKSFEKYLDAKGLSFNSIDLPTFTREFFDYADKVVNALDD